MSTEKRAKTVPAVGVFLGAISRASSLATVAKIMAASNGLLQMKVDAQDGYQTYVVSTRGLGVNCHKLQQACEEFTSHFPDIREPLQFRIVEIEQTGVNCHARATAERVN